MFQRGEVLPKIELSTLDARQYSTVADHGPLLLNFWATWCLPCRAEMASLERLHRNLSPRGLKVAGISVDTDIFLVREYVRNQSLTFPILLDTGGRIAQALFRVPAYPASYLAGEGGVVANSWLGQLDWDSENVRQQIERML
jgi:peroxiredoxin